jgi:nucleoside-diphosphate-sugar epimerase
LIASGIGAVKSGDMATENDPPLPGFPRSQATIITVQLAERGIRTSVVRLPPTVHGPGDKGFVATLVDTARQHGESAYIGEGANRWPAVHRLDAARLLRLAVDRAPAGSILHAVADEAVPTRAIAESIGRHLDVPVVSIRPEEAFGHFGFVGTIFGIDASASSAITRDLLGWQPQHPGLLEDLDLGHYFV